MSSDEIAQTLGMGNSLVKEYLNLVDGKGGDMINDIY